MSFSTKSAAEIERANRMFSIENAVKLGPKEGVETVEVARSFFDFLQENTEISHPSVGFQADTYELGGGA